MKIKLTNTEKEELRVIHRTLSDGQERDRIKSILLLNDGYSCQEISKILLIDNDTVTNWKQTFQKKENIRDWFPSKYKAYSGRLSDEEKKQITEYIDNNMIVDSKILINYLEKEYSVKYSKSGICKLLLTLGFVYKQTTLIPSKLDTEKQKEFKTQYEELEKNLKEDEMIAFIDGVHPQHNTKATRAWIRKGKSKEIKSNTGRQRLNLNGIYNPHSQEILIQEDERINAESTIKFFQKIENYYKEKKKIYLIVDNAKYYKNDKVRKYVENSTIEMIFLPPYSPNLNLIERLWKFMRKEVINNLYYEKFKEFRDAVLGFFDRSPLFKEELKSFIGAKMHLV